MATTTTIQSHIMTYRYIPDTFVCSPSYLGPFTYVTDFPSRRGLRSSCSNCLVWPLVHCSTIGNWAFSVSGPQVWYCLPPEVTSEPSLTTFRTQLKRFLFT